MIQSSLLESAFYFCLLVFKDGQNHDSCKNPICRGFKDTQRQESVVLSHDSAKQASGINSLEF